MPVLDVELVLRPGERLPADFAVRLANAAGEFFKTPAAGTWVKLRTMESAHYAENGEVAAGEARAPGAPHPVFVSVLTQDGPTKQRLLEEVEPLTRVVATICNRPVTEVHLLYLPGARGRVSFGGRILESKS